VTKFARNPAGARAQRQAAIEQDVYVEKIAIQEYTATLIPTHISGADLLDFRLRLRMSVTEFADAYGLSTEQIEEWEMPGCSAQEVRSIMHLK